jgi:hypothetical protein
MKVVGVDPESYRDEGKGHRLSTQCRHIGRWGGLHSTVGLRASIGAVNDNVA